MVDNTNPTSQFHPYNPMNDTPQTGPSNLGSTAGGLGGILSKLGIDQSKLGGLGGSLGGALNNPNLRGGLNNVRAKAQANPGMVLGGLAALVIGAGMMRKRSMGR
jgi:hypothetical protein